MKHSKNILVLTIFLLTTCWPLRAQKANLTEHDCTTKKWYSPAYFKIQYAGNIGFMSLGLGYDWWQNKAQSTLLYGYVPETKGNATIHTFTLKNDFRLYSFSIKDKYNLQPTLGFSLSVEPGQNSYMRIPERFPDEYYAPNCFYACLNLGLKSNFKLDQERYFSSIDVYAEFNTLADYVFYNIIAQEHRSNNIGSMALGVNFFF